MKCNFELGQKVVCINDFEDCLCGRRTPKEGDVCKVAGFDVVGDDVYLRIEGAAPCESYHHTGFRPLEKRKTDISVFHEILKTTKTKEDA